MGCLDLTPVLDAHLRRLSTYSYSLFLFLTTSLQQSPIRYTATSGSGLFHLTIAYKPARRETLTIGAFDLPKVVGKRSFGKVLRFARKTPNAYYVLKTICQANIAKPSRCDHTYSRREDSFGLHDQFIAPLEFSFQNPDEFYLVLSLTILLKK